MDKIEFLVQQKERSRELFMKTGERGHLLDMNYFEERIRKLELELDPRYQETKQLERFVIFVALFTIASPFLLYLFRGLL